MNRLAVVLLLGLLVCAVVDAKSRRTTKRAPVKAAYGNFTNPVLWEDLADIDIFRVSDTYYYSASTMHYSPGAPILRSFDMVNWEYVGHSVPVLDFGPGFSLQDGKRAYVKGIWASFLQFRKSNSLFYWGGCIQGGDGSYIYSSPDVSGPWTKHGPLQPCFYDAGLLIDDDDTMYVAYGTSNINVAQLSADGYSVVTYKQVMSSSGGVYIEGSRFYKHNGYYYLWNTQPSNAQWVARASNVWGPYTSKEVLNNLTPPISGGGIPHQGGLVDTPNGDWYYMAFIDNYPGGRTPVLTPIQWVDDWPVIVTVNNAWPYTYPFSVQPHPLSPMTGTDEFDSDALGPQWEWNHNPDNSRWSTGSGLVLQTATVTQDLFMARNTLTHRILGPKSNGTIALDFSDMADGDCAGLALFRDQMAWIGVMKTDGVVDVVFKTNISMTSSWDTKSTGVIAASVELDESESSIQLALAVDIHPGTGRKAVFYYSRDEGKTFTQFGTYEMTNSWNFFMGYRYGIFNYATQKLGGKVLVDSFTLQAM